MSPRSRSFPVSTLLPPPLSSCAIQWARHTQACGPSQSQGIPGWHQTTPAPGCRAPESKTAPQAPPRPAPPRPFEPAHPPPACAPAPRRRAARRAPASSPSRHQTQCAPRAAGRIAYWHWEAGWRWEAGRRWGEREVEGGAGTSADQSMTGQRARSALGGAWRGRGAVGERGRSMRGSGCQICTNKA